MSIARVACVNKPVWIVYHGTGVFRLCCYLRVSTLGLCHVLHVEEASGSFI